MVNKVEFELFESYFMTDSNLTFESIQNFVVQVKIQPNAAGYTIVNMAPQRKQSQISKITDFFSVRCV